MASASDYVLGHRQSPPGVGLLVLGEDFGSTTPPPPPPPPPADEATQLREHLAAIHDLVAEQIRVFDAARFVRRATDNDGAWSDVGVCSVYGTQILELSDPKGNGGELPKPPPTPTTLLGFAVSYAGHDPARDVYLGYTAEQMEWGRHDSIDLLAPAPGRVEAYTFPTPLGVQMAQCNDERTNYKRLFADGPPCCQPCVFIKTAQTEAFEPWQTMSIAVYWPDQPINGLKALWFGHVRPDIAVGRVDTGGRICTSFDSGVRFEDRGIQARAAHVHCCASATGTLSPNGDADGLRAAAAMGWQVEWRGAGGPGPDQYLTGQWIAGKRKELWAGHPFPPIPA